MSGSSGVVAVSPYGQRQSLFGSGGGGGTLTQKKKQRELRAQRKLSSKQHAINAESDSAGAPPGHAEEEATDGA